MPPAASDRSPDSSVPSPPPSKYNGHNQSNGPGQAGGGRSRRRRSGNGTGPARSLRGYARGAGYTLPEKDDRGFRGGSSRRRGNDITIILCVYDTASQGWRMHPLTFDRERTTDQELWSEIRAAFRQDLQKPWRRIFLFKRLKHIVPIEYTRNDVPQRKDPKDYPDSHQFMHCYHHPRKIRDEHAWVDWFIKWEKEPDKKYGLEFVEGLWAEKLAAVAIAITIAIIVVSVVWTVRGGQLQTVFTVMGFVLSEQQVALIALYYQVTLSN